MARGAEFNSGLRQAGIGDRERKSSNESHLPVWVWAGDIGGTGFIREYDPNQSTLAFR